MRKYKKKGFSLNELIIVILIIALLATATFVVGSASVRKAQVSRVNSDLHNFDVAVGSYMYENRDLANLSSSSPKAEFDKAAIKLNSYLPKDYELSTDPVDLSGTQFTMDASLIAYESKKTDPWGNPYMVLMDAENRNEGETEYYLTTVSAGPNAQANLSGALDDDDIFLLSQYSNGDVSSYTYNMKESETDQTGTTLKAGTASLSASAVYYSPRNIGEAVAIDNTGTSAEPIIISFTIAGTAYQAEDGMTWNDWVNSSYNTDGFIVEDDKISKTVNITSTKKQKTTLVGASPDNEIQNGETVTVSVTTTGGNRQHTGHSY